MTIIGSLSQQRPKFHGWFSWKSANNPAFYAMTRTRELEAKLGIKKTPSAFNISCLPYSYLIHFPLIQSFYAERGV
jgi:hypothetical protein